MIRVQGDWIVWNRVDIKPVLRVIGSDEFKRGKTKLSPTTLRLFKRQGLVLSDKAERYLEREKKFRAAVRSIAKMKDAVPPDRYSPSVVDQLFGHQRVALTFMEFLPSYLLRDQPGVGKTPVAILWSEARSSQRVLVITPNSAKYQWGEEIEKWSQGSLWTSLPPQVSIIEGTVPQQNKIASESTGWVVGHWESLVHARDGILENDWDVVVLDEGHAIVNRKIQRSETAHLLGKTTPHRLILTAHPYYRSPDQLYSLLAFLDPSKYSSFWRYFNLHVEAVPRFFGGMDIIGAKDPKLLRWELSAFTIGRKKKDVFDTVPVSRIPRHVDLPPKYRKDYDELKTQFFAELTGREKKLPILNVLSRTTRLRQFLVDPGILGSKLPSLKYPIVTELLEELDGPPVIFTSFREAAERLEKFLLRQKYRTGIIAGKVNGRKQQPKDRLTIQKRFHNGMYDAVIIVTQAGGTALNFGKYGYVIYLDLPWNAKDLEQTEGRVDRPDYSGKMVHTTAYRIVTRKTYEERIEQKIEDRFAGFNEVFDPNELRLLFAE